MIDSDHDLSNGKDQLNNEDKEVNDGPEYSNTEKWKGINRRLWKDRRMFDNDDYNGTEKRSGKDRRIEVNRRVDVEDYVSRGISPSKF
jgi:hypothetical protein